jgi:hypothetical protein
VTPFKVPNRSEQSSFRYCHLLNIYCVIWHGDVLKISLITSIHVRLGLRQVHFVERASVVHLFADFKWSYVSAGLQTPIRDIADAIASIPDTYFRIVICPHLANAVWSLLKLFTEYTDLHKPLVHKAIVSSPSTTYQDYEDCLCPFLYSQTPLTRDTWLSRQRTSAWTSYQLHLTLVPQSLYCNWLEALQKVIEGSIHRLSPNIFYIHWDCMLSTLMNSSFRAVRTLIDI